MEVEIQIVETGWRVEVGREWAGNIIHRIHSEPWFHGFLAVSSHGHVISEVFQLPGAAIDYVIKAHLQNLNR